MALEAIKSHFMRALLVHAVSDIICGGQSCKRAMFLSQAWDLCREWTGSFRSWKDCPGIQGFPGIPQLFSGKKVGEGAPAVSKRSFPAAALA